MGSPVRTTRCWEETCLGPWGQAAATCQPLYIHSPIYALEHGGEGSLTILQFRKLMVTKVQASAQRCHFHPEAMTS